jgi:two-component system KDP operon response regulator KdpE
VSTGSLILVVDDEAQMRRLVRLTLETNGYRVILAETGEEGIRRAATDRPELIILDLGLPDTDGMEVLRRVREWSRRPIVVLSVRSAEQDIIEALDAGADDYLTKPFRSGELLARVRLALRHRDDQEVEPLWSSGEITVDLAGRTVTKESGPVKLTQIEWSLLSLFLRNEGRVLTHATILKEVWGPSFEGETQYTRVYVASLRKKLETDPSHPRLILTESGIGYRFTKAD